MAHIVSPDNLKDYLNEIDEIKNERSNLNGRAAEVRSNLEYSGQNPALVTKIESMLKTAKKDDDSYTVDEVVLLVETMWNLV